VERFNLEMSMLSYLKNDLRKGKYEKEIIIFYCFLNETSEIGELFNHLSAVVITNKHFFYFKMGTQNL
jgi:hypothetical protein